MFGKNPLRGIEADRSGTLLVHSIFATVQGEGPFAGQSAIFVRLFGCNLRCYFCDTDFESNCERLSADALLTRVRDARAASKIDLIVITGGEPLRQNIAPFAYLAVRNGWEIQVETAGTVWPSELDALFAYESFCNRFHLVCSPKTGLVHPRVAQLCVHYKYIVMQGASDAHGLPLQSTQKAERKEAPALFFPDDEEGTTVWVQPCDEEGSRSANEANRARCVQLALEKGYRVSVQTHKVLGIE